MVRPGRKLAADLGVDDVTRDEVYAALDWLADQQGGTESELLPGTSDGGMALFDLFSSWMPAGTLNQLAVIDHLHWSENPELL